MKADVHPQPRVRQAACNRLGSARCDRLGSFSLARALWEVSQHWGFESARTTKGRSTSPASPSSTFEALSPFARKSVGEPSDGSCCTWHQPAESKSGMLSPRSTCRAISTKDRHCIASASGRCDLRCLRRAYDWSIKQWGDKRTWVCGLGLCNILLECNVGRGQEETSKSLASEDICPCLAVISSWVSHSATLRNRKRNRRFPVHSGAAKGGWGWKRSVHRVPDSLPPFGPSRSFKDQIMARAVWLASYKTEIECKRSLQMETMAGRHFFHYRMSAFPYRGHACQNSTTWYFYRSTTITSHWSCGLDNISSMVDSVSVSGWGDTVSELQVNLRSRNITKILLLKMRPALA